MRFDGAPIGGWTCVHTKLNLGMSPRCVWLRNHTPHRESKGTTTIGGGALLSTGRWPDLALLCLPSMSVDEERKWSPPVQNPPCSSPVEITRSRRPLKPFFQHLCTACAIVGPWDESTSSAESGQEVQAVRLFCERAIAAGKRTCGACQHHGRFAHERAER